MSGKILVVDDDSVSRAGLEILLRRQGFEVAGAESGNRALDESARSRPDLFILDVMMPEMDGFELCRHLKSHPETRLTPVILITGLSATEDRVRGIEAGADDFLNKPVDPNELLARVRSLIRVKAYTDELEKAETVLFTLSASIEARDPYTHGHCERLARNSALLAECLGLETDQVVALRRAGRVHDIGKVSIPDGILLKRGPLSPDEQSIMREHPLVGERICAPLKSFRLVLPIIRHHHEKLDGSGYPDGLRGEQIPLTARILQVVDIYDALTSDRAYREALTPGEAVSLMEQEVRSGWWDARVFAEFRRLLEQNGALRPAASHKASFAVRRPA